MDRYLFEHERALITSEEVKSLVAQCLALAPLKFWTLPAASGGKHHSEDECCAGGLVLHTRRVVGAFLVLFPAYDIKPGSKEYNCGIAACILHDIVKYGSTDAGDRFNFGAYRQHGPNVGRWYAETEGKHEDDWTEEETLVMRLCGSHMGPWSPEGYAPTDGLSWAVFMSDFVASRKDWSGAIKVAG